MLFGVVEVADLELLTGYNRDSPLSSRFLQGYLDAVFLDFGLFIPRRRVGSSTCTRFKCSLFDSVASFTRYGFICGRRDRCRVGERNVPSPASWEQPPLAILSNLVESH